MTEIPTSSETAATIDERALVDFTLGLVEATSTSGNEGEVAARVREGFEQLGFDAEVDELGNVTGTLDAGPGPTLLVDSHMDTVGVTDPGAWSFSPAGELSGGRLYGRGTMDMKGPLAASVHGAAALRDTLERGRIVISASVAEELVEGPATRLVAERVRPDAVIICEATSRRVAVGQRGRAEITIDVAGQPTHSSRPDLGVNAAEAMSDVIAAIRDVEMPPEHPGLSPAILVLTDIISRPYPGLSVVPDRCLATYDRRTLPGETEDEVLEPIRAAIERALAAHRSATGTATIAIDDVETYNGGRLTAPNFAPAWWTGEDAPVARTALAALEAIGHRAVTSAWDFCTNGSGTAPLGIATIGYGPGDEALAHRVDEYIEVDDLMLGAQGYAAIMAALTASEETR